MNLKTYIFVHDQQIVLDYLDQKKFQNFTNVTYVFLGNKNVEKIKNLDNIIICRDLNYNLEDYPKLTSFSGWYALWKNNLIDSDYLNLFEYDINVSPNTEKCIKEVFETGKNIIGYIPLNIHHPNYISIDIWIEKIKNSIKKNYNIDIDLIIKNQSEIETISVTSNHSFHKLVFDDYMKWIEPMIDEIKVSNFSGHEAERSISLFYILNKIDFVILRDLIHHFQFDSHETQGIGKDKFINNYNRLINNI